MNEGMELRKKFVSQYSSNTECGTHDDTGQSQCSPTRTPPLPTTTITTPTLVAEFGAFGVSVEKEVEESLQGVPVVGAVVVVLVVVVGVVVVVVCEQENGKGDTGRIKILTV